MKGFSKNYLLTASLLVLVPYAFFALAMHIGRDSGVFMYSGLIVSEGGMPYTDSWDHKGPLLYLFNALGFYVFDSVRGVIMIEGLLIFVALVAAMYLWNRILSCTQVVMVATAFMATFYATFEGGNLTESWLIPFLLVTYSLGFVAFYENQSNDKNSRYVLFSVMIGVSLAVALMTRLNNGLGLLLLACLAFFILKGRRLQLFLLSLISFLIVLIPILLWLFFNGAFVNFIDQYFVFNFSYSSGVPLRDRLASAYSLLKAVFLSPLGLLTVSLGLYGLVTANGQIKNTKILLPILFTAIFLTDVASQLISGRGYLHYISLASAAFALVVTSLFSVVELRKFNSDNQALKLAIGSIFLIAILVTLVRPIRVVISLTNSGVAIKGNANNEIASYLASRTTPQDLILVHGAETWLLVVTNRRSPTSITYFYPTLSNFKDAFVKYEMDVVSKPPSYIIETPDGCGLIREICPGKIKNYEKIVQLLLKNYAKEAEVHGYVFWRLKRTL